MQAGCSQFTVCAEPVCSLCNALARFMQCMHNGLTDPGVGVHIQSWHWHHRNCPVKPSRRWAPGACICMHGGVLFALLSCAGGCLQLEGVCTCVQTARNRIIRVDRQHHHHYCDHHQCGQLRLLCNITFCAASQLQCASCKDSLSLDSIGKQQ